MLNSLIEDKESYFCNDMIININKVLKWQFKVCTYINIYIKIVINIY